MKKRKKGRRISMIKIREIARLYLELNLGIRAIARSCNISTSTASIYVDRIKNLGATYKDISVLDDDALYELICPEEENKIKRIQPDFDYIFHELKKKHVTLQLLYEEYKRDNPDGYKRSQFYNLYRRWLKTKDPVMRFNHKPGERMFVDFSGEKPHYCDPTTGHRAEVELFVSVLGASSYTFAYAVPDQTKESLVKANVKALEYYGGSPLYIVPDNLKASVTKPCYYDPEINKAFLAMASHYNMAVMPTRVRRPKDKAKVESAVLQVERRIIAVLRNRTFLSIYELNEAILEEVNKLNRRPLSGMDKSRYDLFMEIEKEALRPLPVERFEMASWKKAKVHIDYHVQVEKSYYSVPYTIIGEDVDIRYTDRVVEVYHKNRRVASHMRTYDKGRFITDKLHMPHSHRKYLEWTPERIKSWGEKIGINTKNLIDAVMKNKEHAEHAFRACLGIIRLAKIYPPERVDMACRKALDLGALNYRSVKSLLERKLETTAIVTDEKGITPVHDNIRGSIYYGSEVLS